MAGTRICVVSGSRADYGLLLSPMRLIRDDPELELQLAVTGSHLAEDFGATAREIEADGFTIDACVDSLEPSDSAASIARSLGRGVIGFADALSELGPDIVMLLGDRFEILAATQAALIGRWPIAHLCGGDVTEGAFDDAFRHAMTKMAHLHFVTNELAARRVRQLGEDPAHIHTVGNPALDLLKDFEAMARDAFFEALGLAPRARTILVTFHPVTLDDESSLVQADALLGALDDLGPEVGIILTGPNADTEGRSLSRHMEDYAAGHDNATFHVSLGQTLYFNALTHVDLVLGNSSSGLYEAPSFKLPTVNIGDRQEGRLKAASVIDCAPARDAIGAAIRQALELDCTDAINPYGDGRAGERIVSVLKSIREPRNLIKKRFFDIGEVA